MGCPYEDEGSMTISTSDESYNTTISGVQEDSEYFVSVTAVNSDDNTTSNITTASTDEDSKYLATRYFASQFTVLLYSSVLQFSLYHIKLLQLNIHLFLFPQFPQVHRWTLL